MKTRAPHINAIVPTVARLVAVLAVTAATALSFSTCPAPAQAQGEPTAAYGWPVKPFHRQHPIRGAFGDPRILGKSHSFHFGVDVSCPDGTPVYATVSGRATIPPRHAETVMVWADDDVRFEYWHIEPAIRSGARVVAYRTLLGRVAAPWEHVHFAEIRDGVYVNPLRPGAMGPFSDTTVPTVRSFSVESGGRVQPAARAHGRIDLVVEGYDTTPIPISGPWHGKPLTPALLRWRILDGRTVVSSWRTAVDFRQTYPSNDRWNDVYARWTRQNKKIWNARYRFYLTRDLNTGTLDDGVYRIEVRATDIRGNVGTGTFRLTVANDA